MLPAGMGAAVAMTPTTSDANTAGTWTAHHENVLGTSLAVAIHAPSQATARRAEATALAEFDRQSRILSAWDETSEFSRWRATRGVAVKVSPELLATLVSFDGWQSTTGGILNPATGVASALWQTAALNGKAPAVAALHSAAQGMAQQHWSLDTAHGTATRLSDAPLTLASFVKSRITSEAADAALKAGATGVMLNVGGDIVTRGRIEQRIDIADPRADAENDAPLGTVILQDRAIATSGGYRRNITVKSDSISHLIDPRTAEPARDVLSVSVIARDPQTAGALATALAIASPREAEELTQQHPEAAYLIVRSDGERVTSANWTVYEQPRLQQAAYRVHYGAPAPATVDAAWNQNYELLVKLNLPRIDDPRYRRPFVAVWIEDESKYPVRTIALWFQKPKWLPDLKTWYRDDRVRNLSEGTDLSATISSATRGPGSYTLKWDGKDNEGKLVKPGKYTVCVEASREHGGYGLVRHEMDFTGKPQTAELPAQPEVGAVALDYRKR